MRVIKEIMVVETKRLLKVTAGSGQCQWQNLWLSLPGHGFSHLCPGSALLPLTRAQDTCCSLLHGHLGSKTRTLRFNSAFFDWFTCMQKFQCINTVNKREMWNWREFRLLPQMVIYFALLCGLTGMLPVSFYSQEMWTSITWYLSLVRQALTSFVISRWTKQKKIADAYREITYLVISKEQHFHIVFIWRRSFAASGVLGHLLFESLWNRVTPNASLLLYAGLSVCSVSFTSARNSEMVIYAYWNKHCLQQEYLLLCKRLFALQGDQSCLSFLFAL